jgi:hypothetical protein
VDGEIFSGSGVIEARYRPVPKWMLNGGRIAPTTRGEAIVIEANDRGVFVFLLTGGLAKKAKGQEEKDRIFSPSTAELPIIALRIAPSGGAMNTETIRSLSSIEAIAELSASQLPYLVHFADPGDPGSARRVPLVGGTQNIRLRRATIATTHDPITTEIEKYLPWVADHDSALTAWEAMAERRKRPPVGEPVNLFYWK